MTPQNYFNKIPGFKPGGDQASDDPFAGPHPGSPRVSQLRGKEYHGMSTAPVDAMKS